MIFEPWLVYSALFGSEFYLITTNLQDTLFSGSWQTFSQYYINHHAVCVDPSQCYYVDIYVSDIVPQFYTTGGPSVIMHNLEFGTGIAAVYSSHPGPVAKYRVSFAADVETQEACGIPGCTDPLALNYWPTATQEYDCQYCETNSIVVALEHGVGSSSVNYQIVQEDSVFASGSLPASNGLKQRMHCLPDGCYELRTQGAAWYFHDLHVYALPGDTLASISRTQNEPLHKPFGINSEPCLEPNAVYGCTNPLAANYNPAATVYDGSCNLQNGDCSVSLSLGYDNVNENILLITDVIIGDSEVIWDIKVDWGDGSPPVEATPTMTHTYAEEGDYQVCVNFYTTHFFDLVPVCHSVACININGSEMGQEGGFTVGMQQVILSNSASEAPPQFEIYPNPTQGRFTVILPSDIPEASYSLITADGRVMLTGELSGHSKRIDVNNFAAGLYLMRVL